MKAQEEIELQELIVHGEKKKSATLLVDETKSTPSVKSLIEAADNFEKTTQPYNGKFMLFCIFFLTTLVL